MGLLDDLTGKATEALKGVPGGDKLADMAKGLLGNSDAKTADDASSDASSESDDNSSEDADSEEASAAE